MVYVRIGGVGAEFVSQAFTHSTATRKEKNERYNAVRSGLPNGVSVGTSFGVIWSWSKSVS